VERRCRLACVFRSTRSLILAPDHGSECSIVCLLAAKAYELFSDETLADLYVANGRPSISPRIISVVMVLQRYSGMNDREAVDAVAFDGRWKYATRACPRALHLGIPHQIWRSLEWEGHERRI
jgi:hypothetical protein